MLIQCPFGYLNCTTLCTRYFTHTSQYLVDAILDLSFTTECINIHPKTSSENLCGFITIIKIIVETLGVLKQPCIKFYS